MSVSVSTPGGSLDRRVKLSLRVPAQMGWREMEHKGENVARVILRQGDALVVGVTSVREGERVSLFVSPFSRATPPHEVVYLSSPNIEQHISQDIVQIQSSLQELYIYSQSTF